MGDGKQGRPRGAVRKLLEDQYKLDVEWCAAHESFASVATDPDGFNVSMPAGVQAFIDEMERQVPGSRESMTTVLELGRMLHDGVDWLAAHDNEPSPPAKVEMLLKYYDLMRVVPVSTEEYGLSRAARPFNSRLDKSKLVRNGFTPLPDWRDALARYLRETGAAKEQ